MSIWPKVYSFRCWHFDKKKHVDGIKIVTIVARNDANAIKLLKQLKNDVEPEASYAVNYHIQPWLRELAILLIPRLHINSHDEIKTMDERL